MSRSDDAPDQLYAKEVADSSYSWYRRAAIKARRYHRITEMIQLTAGAAIPVSAAIAHENTTTPAVLGAFVVVTTGLRAAFHWHEDYLRFSQAREAVEAERRRFHTAAPPYDTPTTRAQLLTSAISEIEQREMGAWLKIAKPNRSNTAGP
ncbi:MAG: hypothetical protein JWN03_864 [Nocardia sp.]|uniref:DUF4231 domain-containing protein n=1 Tax=Nocardia sp. TaxID=1821 RepID=UPI0026286F92|nr:DUF4231 domain-containing protein [Nocardia sp.]MCU1640589.1 hypothetical protein [Nocardia sp.]